MIEFMHHGQPVQLEAGRIHASEISNSYRDTTKTTLQEIVGQIADGAPWRDVVERHFAASKPWLYQIITSTLRDRFFREYPPPQGSRVLDVGSGWGQIALPLAASCLVTALEPTPERMAFIHADANQERIAARMHFVQADFLDLEFSASFDLISCVGVMEWVPCFREGPPIDLQIEFLRRARRALAPGGSLIVGIENRVGLKYLLGAADDHLAAPHIGILEYPLARLRWQQRTGSDLRVLTHTAAEYRSLLAVAGFQDCHLFAAYPDYKLPEAIVPADAPDQCATFVTENPEVPEHNGADGSALPMLDEIRSIHRSLAGLVVAHLFAPSYFIVAR